VCGDCPVLIRAVIFFRLYASPGFQVILKIPSSSIAGIVKPAYICHVIVQVMIAVMKKQP